jgi:hypothetical protein
MKKRSITVSTIIGFAAAALMAPVAYAAPFTPSNEACSNGAAQYACLEADRRKAPVGATVVFTGTLSKEAMRGLRSWTKGANVVCLDRYAPAANADGGWPGSAMEGACTVVRKNGGFTIEAEFGRIGTFYYGVSMGPCRSTADECGNSDPGLVGVGGPTHVSVRTTR